MAAEEGDGSRLRAGLGQGHDGGLEAAGSGSEPHRGWRWRPSVPVDPGAPAAGGGSAGPQQHTGERLLHSWLKVFGTFYFPVKVSYFFLCKALSTAVIVQDVL